VASIEHLLHRGIRLADRDRRQIGSEIRARRVALGFTLAELARRARMSTSQVGRIERGEQDSVTVEQLAVLGALVGLDVRTRTYPGPDPSVDAAQLAILARLRARLPEGTSMRLEVPLPIQGDQRAWDAMLPDLHDSVGRRPLPIDIESRLHDFQAQMRRVIMKLRDSGLEVVLLVVGDTHHNRNVLRAAGPMLRADFPVSARSALAALRRGEHPGGSAIVLI
jgi:transcriptional regulator with XRE-family HTH domain